jgi:hypothetical protein
LTEKDIKLKIIEKAEVMAKILSRGNSVEINKVNGTIVKVSEVKKKAM